MAKFQVRPTLGAVAETFRMGTKVAPIVDADRGKAVKLAGESRVELAGANDQIFGFVSSIESGTQDGFKIGGVMTEGYVEADTASLTVGTLVIVDTNPAAGTAGLTKVKAWTAPAEYDPDVALKYMWEVVHPGVIRRV